jgi:hypothetical protein
MPDSQEIRTPMDANPQDDPAGEDPAPEPEDFWADILSADPKRVRRTFDRMQADEAVRVRAHLRRMATEDGWQPMQRDNARAALRAIETRPRFPTAEDP